MEKPGHIIKKRGRVKLLTIILPSCFLLFVIITLLHYTKNSTMDTNSSVKGIILNSAGMPVTDAIVMIKEGSHEFNDMASVSNENGEFFVSNIFIPGRYVLEIKHNDSSITKEIDIQSADRMIRINW